MKSSTQTAVGTALLLGASGLAKGQFATPFEPPVYNGSASGVLLSGQDGWYNPVSGSNDAQVLTYAGNAAGLSTNAQGGSQFVISAAAGNLAFGRAQHAFDFSAGGVWEATWDCTAAFTGTLPAEDNLGSFSLQPSTTSRYFQQLMSWGPTVNIYFPGSVTDYTATADKYHIALGYFTAAVPNTATFETPGPEWRDLPVSNWYRVRVKWDFDTANILEVGIQDITGNGPMMTTDVSAKGWSLYGGPNSISPLPTDIRLFAGGGSGTSLPGNVTAWDNISIKPATTACYANCDGSTGTPILNTADFGCFLTKFAAGDPYANCDGSTGMPTLNVADFGCFLTKFAAGCN